MGVFDYWWVNRDFMSPIYWISGLGDIDPALVENIEDLVPPPGGYTCIYDLWPGLLSDAERAKIIPGDAPEYAAFIRTNFKDFVTKWRAGPWLASTCLPQYPLTQWRTDNTETITGSTPSSSDGTSHFTSSAPVLVSAFAPITDVGWLGALVGTSNEASTRAFTDAQMSAIGFPSAPVTPDPNAGFLPSPGYPDPPAFLPRLGIMHGSSQDGEQPLNYLFGIRTCYLPDDLAGKFAGYICGNVPAQKAYYAPVNGYSGRRQLYSSIYQDRITYVDSSRIASDSTYTLPPLANLDGSTTVHTGNYWLGFEIWIPVGQILEIGPLRDDGKISFITIKGDKRFRILSNDPYADNVTFVPSNGTDACVCQPPIPLGGFSAPLPADIIRDYFCAFEKVQQGSDFSLITMYGVDDVKDSNNNSVVFLGNMVAIHRLFSDYGADDRDSYNIVPDGTLTWSLTPKLYWSATDKPQTLTAPYGSSAPAFRFSGYAGTPWIVTIGGNPYYMGPVGLIADEDMYLQSAQVVSRTAWNIFPRYWTRRPIGFDIPLPAANTFAVEPAAISSVLTTLVDQGFCTLPATVPSDASAEKIAWLSNMSAMDIYMGYGSIGGFNSSWRSNNNGITRSVPAMAIGVSGRVYVHDRLRVLADGAMTPDNLIYSFIVRSFDTLAPVIPRYGSTPEFNATDENTSVYSLDQQGIRQVWSGGVSSPGIASVLTDDVNIHTVQVGGTWYSAWSHLGAGVVQVAAGALEATTAIRIFGDSSSDGYAHTTGSPITCVTAHNVPFPTFDGEERFPPPSIPNADLMFGFNTSVTSKGPDDQWEYHVTFKTVAPFFTSIAYVSTDHSEFNWTIGGAAELDGGVLCGTTVQYGDGTFKALPDYFLNVESMVYFRYLVDQDTTQTVKSGSEAGQTVRAQEFVLGILGAGSNGGAPNDMTGTFSTAEGKSYFNVDSVAGAAYPKALCSFDAAFVQVSASLQYTLDVDAPPAPPPTISGTNSARVDNAGGTVTAGGLTVSVGDSHSLGPVGQGGSPQHYSFSKTTASSAVVMGNSFKFSITTQDGVFTGDHFIGPPEVDHWYAVAALSCSFEFMSLQECPPPPVASSPQGIQWCAAGQTRFSIHKKVSALIGSTIEPVADFPIQGAYAVESMLAGVRQDGAGMCLSLPNRITMNSLYGWDPEIFCGFGFDGFFTEEEVFLGATEFFLSLKNYAPVHRHGRYSFVTMGKDLPIVHAGGNITHYKIFGSAGTIAPGPNGTLVFTGVSPGFCAIIAVDDYNKLACAEIVYVHPPFKWRVPDSLPSGRIFFTGKMQLFAGPATALISGGGNPILGLASGYSGGDSDPNTLSVQRFVGDTSGQATTDVFTLAFISLSASPSELTISLSVPVVIAGNLGYQARAYYSMGDAVAPPSPAKVVPLESARLVVTSTGVTLVFADNRELPRNVPICVYIDLIMAGGNEIARCPFLVTIAD